MIAVTDLPASSPRSRAASTVIEATKRWPLTSISTLAIAAPSLTLVTVPESWLRALSFMAATILAKTLVWWRGADDAARGPAERGPQPGHACRARRHQPAGGRRDRGPPAPAQRGRGDGPGQCGRPVRRGAVRGPRGRARAGVR